jgi:hypothetical protein
MLIIYLSFASRSFQSYRATREAYYKKAFLSLAVMSICFILVFIMFLIDRLLILLGSPGFTVFYFLAWSFAVLGILGAYLGYIKPKSK